MHLAGLYVSYSLHNISRETSRLQNYFQIYADYDCKNPQKNCLIVTNHKLEEECIDADELITKTQGIYPKLNAERLPVCTKEYPNIPCVVLLPHYDICSSFTLISKIANDILICLVDFKPFRDTFDFYQFLRNADYIFIETTVSYQILLNSLIKFFYNDPNENKRDLERDYLVYCKLHNRYYINYPKTHPLSTFIISSQND